MSEGATGYTPCEEYGHNYETDPDDLTMHVCGDCGDSYQD